MEDKKYLEIVTEDFEPDPDESVFDSLAKQYEYVVVQSILTSFALDFMLVKDQHGGDVDTVHNIRNGVGYKNKRNESDYDNRGEYNPDTYHQHENYKNKSAEVSKQKKAGTLQDSYTSEKMPRNANVDLDHTISAKEIHDDPGRVLSGLKGEDLANTDSNLNPTNSSINRSKKAKSADEFIKKMDETMYA